MSVEHFGITKAELDSWMQFAIQRGIEFTVRSVGALWAIRLQQSPSAVLLQLIDGEDWYTDPNLYNYVTREYAERKESQEGNAAKRQ